VPYSEKRPATSEIHLSKIPPGVEGVVIDAKIFTRKGAEKDDRSQAIEDEDVESLIKDRDDEIRIITNNVKKRFPSCCLVK